jgi:hypothetical protein
MDSRYVSEVGEWQMGPGSRAVGLHIAFNGKIITGLGLALAANPPNAS